MKKKKAQFYLAAILIILSLVIGLANIGNQIKVKKTEISLFSKSEIQQEKTKVLDYIAKNNLNPTQANLTLQNFSLSYLDFFADEKTTFFIWGNYNSSRPFSYLYYVFKSEKENDLFVLKSEYELILRDALTPTVYSISQDNFTVRHNNFEYNFKLNDGQNIYYLIKYDYDKEVYIIYG